MGFLHKVYYVCTSALAEINLSFRLAKSIPIHASNPSKAICSHKALINLYFLQIYYKEDLAEQNRSPDYYLNYLQQM
jgi:hypothetical protein